jgi:hypothetical protein
VSGNLTEAQIAGRNATRELARHWEARARTEAAFRTHWAGCELEHRECALWLLASYILNTTEP